MPLRFGRLCLLGFLCALLAVSAASYEPVAITGEDCAKDPTCSRLLRADQARDQYITRQVSCISWLVVVSFVVYLLNTVAVEPDVLVSRYSGIVSSCRQAKVPHGK
jgi:hypothetical protein